MGGFKNSELNNILFQDFFEKIINIVIACSDRMYNECICKGEKIPNHEEKIRTYLVENYLDNDDIRGEIKFKELNLRFIIEVPEGYNQNEYTYCGRVDIKVVGESWFRNSRDYFIIECKRIDGSNDLNKKYVSEGICRFVSEPIKYNSYNNKNLMFGFVVKDIDIDNNTISINKIQKDCPNIFVKQEFTKAECELTNSCIYLSKYTVKEKALELRHLFYNFSKIIKEKSVG